MRQKNDNTLKNKKIGNIQLSQLNLLLAKTWAGEVLSTYPWIIVSYHLLQPDNFFG